MKRAILAPAGWLCTIGECPPGPFMYQNELGFKTDYFTDNHVEVYKSGGSIFWGGAESKEDRDTLIVQPVVVEWEEYDV